MTSDLQLMDVTVLMSTRKKGLLSRSINISSTNLFHSLFTSVVLLDLSMPVLDGLSLLTFIDNNRIFINLELGVGATLEIRKLESHKQITTGASPRTRILALTGMSSLEDKRRAFEAGVDG